MNNPLATPIATPSAVILRASDKDARRTSTSASATNCAHAHSPVRAQHCFTLSLEECAPSPQDLNHMAPHV
jgi:hypothetical protein